MSEIVKIIDSLETKVKKLLTKIDDLEKNKLELEEKLAQCSITIEKVELAEQKIKDDFESLKISSALLGSEDYKRDTKLKINSLIREIDFCIAQLSD